MKYFIRFLKKIYLRYFLKVKKGKCLFIPHPGFTNFDKASIINYKADNCLIFVRYMLDNGLYKDKELVVVSTTPEQAHREQEFCDETYPKAKISIIPDLKYNSRLYKSNWASSEYIFSSEELFPIKKKSSQIYVCLTYYPISLKNDFFDPRHPVYGKRLQLASQVDFVASSSLINSQMDAAYFGIPFYKFCAIGKCRSDVLLKDEDVKYVREYIQTLCQDFKFSKIILYTPTHRDYERSVFDVKRSILGFNVNKEKFEKFLCDNELVIVCKLHPMQNSEIVDTNLPKGVVNFAGVEDFGLIELMKASDVLMTDYTSTYVDYLLLEKPVIFNFYDLDLYEKERGLSFYPFRRICAGETFYDEESFYRAILETMTKPNKYTEKRAEILEEMMTYKTNVCDKTYEILFKK